MTSEPDARAVYTSPIFGGRAGAKRDALRMVTEPAREVPVLDEVDVLVVGGGPAGTAAAVAAARLGAHVMLVERYNHLGGLSTGGLVIWIDRMTDWQGTPVICGIGAELLDRLPADAIHGPTPSDWGSHDVEALREWKPRFAAFHDTVTWSPMIDPEQLKAVSLAMVREAGAKPLFHAIASLPLVGEDGRISGVVFEGKQGRFAIAARVTIDTTGDGDVFARAGEPSAADIEPNSIHHCVNTAWLWGGVDETRWMAFRADTAAFAAFTAEGRGAISLFDLPMTTWRKDVALFLGPRLSGYDALDVRDLTEVELRSRDIMLELLAFYRRRAPGFEGAWILLTAPQIGVRQSRRLVGKYRLTREDWRAGVLYTDEIGVSPSLGPQFASVSVPYRCLLPATRRGLLVAGRHLSSDASSHSFMREIPQCWLTGHAAGAAAALAVDRGVDPLDVPVRDLQDVLAGQGAFLRAPALQG